METKRCKFIFLYELLPKKMNKYGKKLSVPENEVLIII